METDGEILKAYLTAKGIGREDFAGKLGITRQGLYRKFNSKAFKPATRTTIEKTLRTKWAEILASVHVYDNVSKEEDMQTITMKPTFGVKPNGVSVEELQKKIIQLEEKVKTLQEMIDKLLQKR